MIHLQSAPWHRVQILQRFLVLVCIIFSTSIIASAQNESFSLTVLNTKPGAGNYNLAHPFEIIYGPDNYLYVTEKVGRVLRIDTGTGVRQILLDIRSQVSLHITRDASGAATFIGQSGMLGMALHPNFNLGTGQDSIFVVYTASVGNVRIVRYKFNGGPTPSLTGPTIIIQGLPGSIDHSTGRLIVGADNKLYYSCGDMGANQYGHRCNIIKSQDVPTAAEINANNYTNYAGKILRLELNGSIPANNPLFNGVRSHIYTIGHRNAQGLVWEKVPSSGSAYPQLVAGGKLFSSEHGRRTDDELNIIEAGENYGWPYIAGDLDNINYQYVIWGSSSQCAATPFAETTIPVGATVMEESDAPVSIATNFKRPMYRMFTDCGSRPASICNAGGTDFLRFPTIAPGSLDYYNNNGGLAIPGWYPSLLIPALKKGTVYRVKLNANRDAVSGDTIPYFKTANRYRDMAISPDGLKIFLVTDSIGITSGPTFNSVTTLANPGAIMVYRYAGAALPLRDDRIRPENQYVVNIFPNPANRIIHVNLETQFRGPFRYELYDITGKKIHHDISPQNRFSIIVTDLKRGMYMLRIFNRYDMEVKVKKIMLM